MSDDIICPTCHRNIDDQPEIQTCSNVVHLFEPLTDADVVKEFHVFKSEETSPWGR